MTLLARVCGIAAALMLEASCSLAGAAADPVSDFRTYGPFAVRSDGSGQLSSDTYAIGVVTAGKLEVSYLAPRSHCSSLKMHFLVDGVEKAVSAEVLPGHTTGYVNLGPVASGEHAVALQAEGIEGGCNSGHLSAWAGSGSIWTTHLPSSADAPIDSIAAGCGGGVKGTWWSVRINADGSVRRSKGPSYPHPAPVEMDHVPVEQAQALFAQAQRAQLMSLQLDLEAEYLCSLALTAGGIRHQLLLGTDPHRVPADVEAVFAATVALGRADHPSPH